MNFVLINWSNLENILFPKQKTSDEDEHHSHLYESCEFHQNTMPCFERNRARMCKTNDWKTESLIITPPLYLIAKNINSW